MNQTDDTLNLTFQFETEVDPRAALYNDYKDQVRDARETLRLFYLLREDGLLPVGNVSPWWQQFLADLAAEVARTTDHN